jgi:hypothetical protein
MNMGNTSVTYLSIDIPAVYAVTAHFTCLVVFDELDADSNHRLTTARGTCRYLSLLLGRLGGFAAGCFRGIRRI